MMIRRLGLLLALLALAACALPFDRQPPQASRPPTSVVPPAVTAPADVPTQAPAGATALAATSQPESSPSGGTPAPSGAVDDPARLEAAVPLARDQVALAEAFRSTGDIPEVARTQPLDVKVGDVESFWVQDFASNTNKRISARLLYAGPVALMYVDTALDVDLQAVEQAAKTFEQQIYPRDRAVFGEEASPGVDGDPRLTIVNTVLNGGAAGYFYGANSVPKAANPYSNEREMFVMSVSSSESFLSQAYGLTLAHEFQHMIEWNQQRRSPTWFNEGMSTIAQDVNGYVTQAYAQAYLPNPDLQLTGWDPLAAPHYGAAQLFLRYVQEQYAGEKGLAELIKADAGNNPAAFATIAARKRPDIKSFADLYADWAVANLLDDPTVGDGRYAYQLLPGRVQPGQAQQQTATTVNQFGVDYYGDLRGPLAIDFAGAPTVLLTGARPKDGRYAWWSNRGDDSVETLTRAFDLRGVKQATLQFAAWYEIETDFDYAFVGVSTDGGKTWSALKGNTTSTDDPHGNNFGNGITGISGAPGVETGKGTRGQWIDEYMDLGRFAGKQILLRFWVVNDDAANAPGLLIDDIRIPELNYADGAENGDGGWQAQGFARTTGMLPQTWALRLVRVKGGATTVEPLAVDAQGHARAQIAAGERATLAVIGTTPLTTEPASYSYALSTP